MNFNILMMAGLAALGTAGMAPSQIDSDSVLSGKVQSTRVVQTIAQTNEPAEARPSIATVNPDRPIQIRVVNQSTIPVEIGARLVQPSSGERTAAPQSAVTFGRLHTSFLPVPIDLSIFAKVGEVSLDEIEVEVVNNEIIITVAATPGVTTSLRAIRVDAAGNIYLY